MRVIDYGHADRVRRATSTVMTTLTGLCTLLAVTALAVILFYIAWRGIGSLSFQFLTDRPRPVGEGGGIGNAILGSVVLLLISSAIGLPLGICVGIYLSEIGRGRLGGAIRFIIDTLTGIPSIVTGVFVYAIMVVPMKHFSALAGGISLALIMIQPATATRDARLLFVAKHLERIGDYVTDICELTVYMAEAAFIKHMN